MSAARGARFQARAMGQQTIGGEVSGMVKTGVTDHEVDGLAGLPVTRVCGFSDVLLQGCRLPISRNRSVGQHFGMRTPSRLN